MMTSDKATGALVVGIPVAVAVLAVIWARPHRRPVIWGAISTVIVILSATGLVAALRGGGLAAEQAGGPTPTSTEGLTPTTTPMTCAPSGPALQLVAKNISFGVSCLAAPAHSPLRISFDNEDSGISHSFHILKASPAADPSAGSLFIGKIVAGPASIVYRVRPLPPGTYYFQCDVHPNRMNGTFIVR